MCHLGVGLCLYDCAAEKRKEKKNKKREGCKDDDYTPNTSRDSRCWWAPHMYTMSRQKFRCRWWRSPLSDWTRRSAYTGRFLYVQHISFFIHVSIHAFLIHYVYVSRVFYMLQQMLFLFGLPDTRFGIESTTGDRFFTVLYTLIYSPTITHSYREYYISRSYQGDKNFTGWLHRLK